MKIFEQILDRRIREIVKLSHNECDFESGCGIINTTLAACLPAEKHHEKEKPVHLAFLDMEKVLDREARGVIWHGLRQHGVHEQLVHRVCASAIVYPTSRVHAAAGTPMKVPISVGVSQNSDLSPLPFVSVPSETSSMDVALF